MSHTPHQLSEEFPHHADRVHSLSMTDAHFRQLSEKYGELNEAIYRAETNLEPVDQFHEATLRKERLRLKDEIARLLATSN